MGELTLLERIRQWLGDRCFDVFLWSRSITEAQYISDIRSNVTYWEPPIQEHEIEELLMMRASRDAKPESEGDEKC